MIDSYLVPDRPRLTSRPLQKGIAASACEGGVGPQSYTCRTIFVLDQSLRNPRLCFAVLSLGTAPRPVSRDSHKANWDQLPRWAEVATGEFCSGAQLRPPPKKVLSRRKGCDVPVSWLQLSSGFSREFEGNRFNPLTHALLNIVNIRP